jgi:hypothetical protein
MGIGKYTNIYYNCYMSMSSHNDKGNTVVIPPPVLSAICENETQCTWRHNAPNQLVQYCH